jgi:hypothetical protein
MLLHTKLLTDWWISLRMAGKRQTVPLVMGPQHWRQMYATWNKWNLSLDIHKFSFTAIATEVRISPASVYHLLTNSWGKWKVCAKWISYVLNNDQRAMHVLLVTTDLQRWSSEGSAFFSHIWTDDESWMHSFDPQLKWQNAEWCTQMSPRKTNAWHMQGALKVMHIVFFSRNGRVFDHPVTIGATVNGQYYGALL